ncbi:hypothetical protein WCE37_13530 [Luteimonas sp. MJ250]|uniref:hypothetical protein n=1 Tax=Luteimonas sp. MJ250 TaxID=3129236 RepID=UPI0031BAF91F
MERIVKVQLPKAIYAVTGAKVKEAELQVSGLEDGSFIEDLKIKLLFKSEEDYQKCLDSLSDSVKAAWEGGTPVLKIAIGVLVGALVLNGLGLLPGGQPNGMLSHIEGDNNAVVIIGAETYARTPKEFEAAIESAINRTSNQRRVQAAMDATAPAREQGVALEFEGDNGSQIQVVSQRTAASLPSSVDPEDTSEDASLSRVRVKLRATDNDSAVKGWAASIPGQIETRTRLVFASESEASKAAFRPEIVADVTVTYSSPAHQKAVLIIVDKVY